MTGNDLYTLLRGIRLEEIIEESINETSEEGADALAVQLSQGIDGNGMRLDPYAPATIALKRKKGVGLGAVTDRRTNYMTGAHYKGLYIKAYSGSLETGSKDEKSVWLQAQNGEAMYKLGPDAKEDYEPAHFNKVKAKIEAKTGLTFK